MYVHVNTFSKENVIYFIDMYIQYNIYYRHQNKDRKKKEGEYMEKQDTNKEKTKAIQFRIEESLLSRFNEITRRYSVNKSALIRQWIEKYIEQHEE